MESKASLFVFTETTGNPDNTITPFDRTRFQLQNILVVTIPPKEYEKEKTSQTRYNPKID